MSSEMRSGITSYEKGMPGEGVYAYYLGRPTEGYSY